MNLWIILHSYSLWCFQYFTSFASYPVKSDRLSLNCAGFDYNSLSAWNNRSLRASTFNLDRSVICSDAGMIAYLSQDFYTNSFDINQVSWWRISLTTTTAISTKWTLIVIARVTISSYTLDSNITSFWTYCRFAYIKSTSYSLEVIWDWFAFADSIKVNVTCYVNSTITNFYAFRMPRYSIWFNVFLEWTDTVISTATRLP